MRILRLLHATSAPPSRELLVSGIVPRLFSLALDLGMVLFEIGEICPTTCMRNRIAGGTWFAAKGSGCPKVCTTTSTFIDPVAATASCEDAQLADPLANARDIIFAEWLGEIQESGWTWLLALFFKYESCEAAQDD